MELRNYQIEHSVQSFHWWFVARRNMFKSIIGRLNLSPNDPILDIGTSTGTNLVMLKELGFNSFKGLDTERTAIEFCASRGFPNTIQGDACSIPMGEGSAKLVLATDILEHIPDDGRALREIYRVLAPGGWLLVTVPAFRILWGLQDDMSHHLRRYTKSELLSKMRQSGFRIDDSYFFNYLLLPPIFVARKLLNLIPHKLENENQLNNKWLNAILFRIFSADIRFAPRLRLPAGLSLLVLAQKPSSNGDKTASHSPS